jgi:hypothetical protein
MTGAIEVRLWRDGTMVARQWCEAPDDAAAVVSQWAEWGISAVDVDDLSVHHRGGQILEPDLEVDAAGADSEEEWPPL